LVPSRYFIEVSRDAFERGLGGARIYLDFIVLVLFAMLFFFISWSAWRRMQFKV
jgi:ABC-2 type transport system permease protein